MPGTNVYSVIYYAGAAILLLILVAYLVKVWRGFSKDLDESMEKQTKAPSWVPPSIKTILAITFFIVVATFGWNALQGVTTNASDYQNPAEQAEKKEVMESKPPSQEEMDKVRSSQKRNEEAAHSDALSSFEESMQKEADKIKKRSMGN